MIFVTVGNPRNSRLTAWYRKVDELKRDGIIREEVVMQTGFSTYEPQYCQWSKLIPYQQMVQNVAKRPHRHYPWRSGQLSSCRCRSVRSRSLYRDSISTTSM